MSRAHAKNTPLPISDDDMFCFGLHVPSKKYGMVFDVEFLPGMSPPMSDRTPLKAAMQNQLNRLFKDNQILQFQGKPISASNLRLPRAAARSRCERSSTI